MRCTPHPTVIPPSQLREESLTCAMQSGVQDSPLLLQVRVFRGGGVWKGVLCVNLKLPPRTIQLRPSMHKVLPPRSLKVVAWNDTSQPVPLLDPILKVKRDDAETGECFAGGIMVCQTR